VGKRAPGKSGAAGKPPLQLLSSPRSSSVPPPKSPKQPPAPASVQSDPNASPPASTPRKKKGKAPALDAQSVVSEASGAASQGGGSAAGKRPAKKLVKKKAGKKALAPPAASAAQAQTQPGGPDRLARPAAPARHLSAPTLLSPASAALHDATDAALLKQLVLGGEVPLGLPGAAVSLQPVPSSTTTIHVMHHYDTAASPSQHGKGGATVDASGVQVASGSFEGASGSANRAAAVYTSAGGSSTGSGSQVVNVAVTVAAQTPSTRPGAWKRVVGAVVSATQLVAALGGLVSLLVITQSKPHGTGRWAAPRSPQR
jgi:hypothetical protein